jgi:hypothetical protein
MISHEHKFIFVGINKTASTSICKALSCPGGSKHKHNLNIISPRTKDYFKFCFVRNPWDRALSLYRYRRKIFGFSAKITTHKDFIIQVIEPYHNPTNVWKHFNDPQLNWICNQKGQVMADYIGRYENLQEDFNVICNKIGIPQKKLLHTNSTTHKHYSEYYDDETREIIAQKYAKDIEYFGYEF